MRLFFIAFIYAILFGGCATWQGMKQDGSDAADWTKSKINEGANYVKEKTE